MFCGDDVTFGEEALIELFNITNFLKWGLWCNGNITDCGSVDYGSILVFSPKNFV